MIATALVIGLLLAVSWTDVRTGRIPNRLTYPGIIAAFLLHAAADLLRGRGVLESGAVSRWVSSLTFLDSLLGFAACGGMMLVCFVFLAVGGGDVKLGAFLGAILGMERGLSVLLWTVVFAACYALLLLIWRIGAARLLGKTARHLWWTVRLRRPALLDQEEQTTLRTPLHMAPWAFLAVLAVLSGV